MQTLRLPHVLAALGLSLALAACGGTRPTGETPDAGSVDGLACQFDTDCAPPDYICGAAGKCEAGCLKGGCITGKVCNATTGRCTTGTGGGADGGGTDGGGTDGGGTDGGSTTGTPSPTLCGACTVNGDCQGGGLCVSNQQHTAKYCTQDCTTDPCPTGYQCTTDSTGTRHQCFPSTGECTGSADGGTDGGTTGGTDGGVPSNDPTVPSDNPSGCKMCGQCAVNNDCIQGAFCLNGICATPCSQSGVVGALECALAGGSILSQCADVGLPNGQKLCVPLLGACISLPSPLTPLSGDLTCVPSGTNPSCAAASVPSPGFGANVSVTAGLSPKPMMATEDSVTRDSQGRMALGFIGVDSSGNSYMGFCSSADDGATWTNCGKQKTSVSGSVQSDPVLVTSKWTDGSGAHERMHYVWVSYVLSISGGTATPKDMTMEASYSDDGGKTWSTGTKVTTSADNGGGTLLLDKPWIDAGPDGTLVYTYSVGDNSQQHMYASISSDHGASWQAKKVMYSGAVLGDNNFGHNLGMPVFDPSDATGSTIYAVYVKYTAIEATTQNSIELVRSTDKGATWKEVGPVSAATDQVLFEPPSIAMDANKHLYVGYIASPQGQDARYWDAMVATVDTSLATPTVVRRVKASNDQAACYQHFHSMVTVDRATGNVYAAWLDNRSGGKGNTWASKSTDQGATFGANVRVSSSDYTFNPDHQNSQLNFLGDYFGIVFSGGKLRLVWSDPRDGSSSQVFYAAGAP